MPNHDIDAVEVKESLSNQKFIEDKPASLPTTPRKEPQTPSYAAISPDVVKINPFLYGREDKKPKRFVALTEGFSPATEDKFKARLKRRFNDEVCREAAAVKYTPSKGTAVAISPSGTHYRKRSRYGNAQLNVSVCVAAPIPPVLLDQPPTPAPVADTVTTERQHSFVMSSAKVAAQKRKSKSLKKNKAVMGGKTANEISRAAGLKGQHEYAHGTPRCVAGADGQVRQNLTVETKSANTRELIVEKYALAMDAKVDLQITGIQHECIPEQRKYVLTAKVDGLTGNVSQQFDIDTRDPVLPTRFDVPVLQEFQNSHLNALVRKEKDKQNQENREPNVTQTFFKSPPKSPSLCRLAKQPAVSDKGVATPPSSPTSVIGTFFKPATPQTTVSGMILSPRQAPPVTIAKIFSAEQVVDGLEFLAV